MDLSVDISGRAPAPSEARNWRFLGWILVLQAALTALDPTPRYLIGDSTAYLWSVFHDGPWDRSWTCPAGFLRPSYAVALRCQNSLGTRSS
jgi:hypothetical protein